jgi:dimethylargininase
MFTKAILRLPGANLFQGLTTVDLGIPHFPQVLEQYAHYCDALRACGLALTILEADLRHPDSTFVEDTVVLTAKSAIFTRPGAPSREGEVTAIRTSVEKFFSKNYEIQSPGTLDGGDICEAEDHFFLGLSHRTNEEGARQLASYLAGEGYTTSLIDVRAVTSILHLKSGISYIGNNTIVAMEELASHPALQGYSLITVEEKESYAANCVRVNDRVLVPAGYPNITASLNANGFQPLELNMSEFQKMDGGLSCLSLRF